MFAVYPSQMTSNISHCVLDKLAYLLFDSFFDLSAFWFVLLIYFIFMWLDPVFLTFYFREILYSFASDILFSWWSLIFCSWHSIFVVVLVPAFLIFYFRGDPWSWFLTFYFRGGPWSYVSDILFSWWSLILCSFVPDILFS